MPSPPPSGSEGTTGGLAGEVVVSRREALLAALGFVAILLLVYGSVITPRASLVYSSNFNPLDYRSLEQNYGPGFRAQETWHGKNLLLYANFHDPGTAWWQWEPAQVFLRKTIRRGELPFWDPYVAAGAPALAQLLPAFAFPPNLLLAIAGGSVALLDLAFLGLLLTAALCTYLFLRKHALSTVAAFFGGASFLASGGLNQNVGSLAGHAAACIPIALYLSRRFLDRPTWGRTVALAGGYAAISLASLPPVLLGLFALASAYTVVHLLSAASQVGRSQTIRSLGRLAAGVALAAGLVAFYYVPAIVLHTQTPQVGIAYSGAAIQHVGPAALFDLLSPLLSDGHKVLIDPPIGDLTEPVLFYVGPLPLLAALFVRRSSGSRRGPLLSFLLWSSALLVLKLLGLAPAQWVARLPLVDTVHLAHYSSIHLNFLVAALGAIGIDALFRKGASPGRLAAASILVVATLHALWRLGVAAGVAEHQAAATWVGEWRQTALLAAGGLSWVALGALPPLRRHLGRAVGCALVALVVTQGYGDNRLPRQQDWDVWRNPPPYVARLAAQAGWGRVFTMGALPANAGSAFEIFTVDSLHTFNPPRIHRLYQRFFAPGKEVFLRGATRLPPDAVLNALAVEHLAVRNHFGEIADEARARGYRRWYSDGFVTLLERSSPPRFYLTGDFRVVPGPLASLEAVARTRPWRQVILEDRPSFPSYETSPGAVRVTSFNLNAYTLEVEASRPALLYSSDSFFPGWSATIDGDRTEILAANHAFRAVVVPAGRSSVRFRYWPPGLTAGLVVSALSLLVAGALVHRQRVRGRSVSASAAEAGA